MLGLCPDLPFLALNMQQETAHVRLFLAPGNTLLGSGEGTAWVQHAGGSLVVNVPVISREFVLKCLQVKERVMFERPGWTFMVKW